MVWPPPCTEGNQARGGLAKRSILNTAGSGMREAISETDLRVGKAQGLSTELTD